MFLKFSRVIPNKKVANKTPNLLQSVTSPKLRKRLGIGSVKGKNKNAAAAAQQLDVRDYTNVLGVIDSYSLCSRHVLYGEVVTS